MALCWKEDDNDLRPAAPAMTATPKVDWDADARKLGRGCVVDYDDWLGSTQFGDRGLILLKMQGRWKHSAAHQVCKSGRRDAIVRHGLLLDSRTDGGVARCP